MKNNKLGKLLVINFLGFVSFFLYIYLLKIGDLRANTVIFEYIYFLLFFIYLTAFFIVFKTKNNPNLIYIIILFAILFKIPMVWSTPTLSDDIYRYIWDGKIQASGINPYTTFPAKSELKDFRDDSIFPKINSKSKYDPYQPVSQIFFLINYKIGNNNLLIFKLILSIFDIFSILILISILKKLKIDISRSIVYAWSPLVIFEISHSGHIDGLIVFFLLAAVLARIKKRSFLSGIFLGLSIPVKLYSLFLVPAFLRGKDYKLPTALISTVILVYLPYLEAGWQIFRFIFFFQQGPSFNAGLRGLVHMLFGSSNIFADKVFLIITLIIMLLVAIIVISRKERNNRDFFLNILILSGTFVVFLPFLVGWYLLFIIPFLSILPSYGLIYISGTVTLSYIFYTQKPWNIPIWVWLIEYIPFYLLIAIEIIYWLGFLPDQLDKKISNLSEKWLQV